MKLAGLVFLIVFIFSVSNISPAVGQAHIENPNQDDILYCSDPVLVVPDISIQNIEFDLATKGMKISIFNYKSGEDVLSYNGNLNSSFDDVNGYLEITGEGTAADSQLAARNVYYSNAALVPDAEDRVITIGLLDADYLPFTEHFYQFVSEENITWKKVRDRAASLKYYGLEGYFT